LELLAQKQGLPELRHYLKDIEVLMCEKKRIDKLRSLLTQLFNKMTKKDLQVNNFPGHSVTDIAMEWNLWHMRAILPTSLQTFFA